MSDDLVKRLRGFARHPLMDGACKVPTADLLAAADRIEELERELDALADGSLAKRRAGLKAYATIVRREALEEAARCIEPKNPREDWTEYAHACAENATAIRALKEKE